MPKAEEPGAQQQAPPSRPPLQSDATPSPASSSPFSTPTVGARRSRVVGLCRPNSSSPAVLPGQLRRTPLPFKAPAKKKTATAVSDAPSMGATEESQEFEDEIMSWLEESDL